MWHNAGIFIFILQYAYAFSILFDYKAILEYATLTSSEIATKYGHPPEEYTVTTEDDYILNLFRLPGKSRYPVLLLHGFADTANTFLIRGRNSLAITLARDNYDVWLGNTRGNPYSRKHVYLNPDKDRSYWEYTFNEVGYYDVPAFINKILKVTNAPNVTIIGHSQGNTALFVLGSSRPEYNSKINVMMALAPITYLHHSHFLSPIAPFTPFIEEFVEKFEIVELFGDNSFIVKFIKFVCDSPGIGYFICTNLILFPLNGYDITELEPSFAPVVGNNFPRSYSAMGAVHFLQEARSKSFRRFDYGGEKNLVVYNSTVPPNYDLQKVTMPVALFAGRNDYLSSLEDVELLRKQLPNVVYNKISPNPKMNHLDNTEGRSMDIYLFPYIYEVLRRFNGYD